MDPIERLRELADGMKAILLNPDLKWCSETFDAQRGIKEQEKELDSVLKVVLITEERWQTIKIHFNKGL